MSDISSESETRKQQTVENKGSSSNQIRDQAKTSSSQSNEPKIEKCEAPAAAEKEQIEDKSLQQKPMDTVMKDEMISD